MKKGFNSATFRKELLKIKPGYKWTVHRTDEPEKYIEATGIKTAGFNRLSTLSVIRRNVISFQRPTIRYEVKSSGFGLKAPWLATKEDGTLARALRGLQEHYQNMASQYSSHAMALETARKKNQAI